MFTEELLDVGGARADGDREGTLQAAVTRLDRLADRSRIEVVNWKERISIDPSVRTGKPCVKGTRITVFDVLEYLAGGMSEDQILADFPSLTREDIRACLSFAATRERRLTNSLA